MALVSRDPGVQWVRRVTRENKASGESEASRPTEEKKAKKGREEPRAKGERRVRKAIGENEASRVTRGEEGARGNRGEKGETGEKGDRGERGESSVLKSAVYTSISPRLVSKDWASYLEVQVVATGRGRTIVFAYGTITVADPLSDFPIEIAIGSGSASSPTANLPDKSLTNSFDASQGQSIPFTVFNTYEVPGAGVFTYSLLARCPLGGEQLVRPGTISAVYVPNGN